MKACFYLIAGLVLISLIAGLVGCVSARRSEPLSGPLKASTPAVTHGEQLYMRFCNQCHPGGDAGLGPAINNKPLPGFLIKTQVRRGMGRMPAFSEKVISPSDLNDIVTYLKAQRQRKREN